MPPRITLDDANRQMDRADFIASQQNYRNLTKDFCRVTPDTRFSLWAVFIFHVQNARTLRKALHDKKPILPESEAARDIILLIAPSLKATFEQEMLNAKWERQETIINLAYRAFVEETIIPLTNAIESLYNFVKNDTSRRKAA